MWTPSSFVEAENLNNSQLLTCPFCSWARNDGVGQCQVKGDSNPWTDVTQHLLPQSRHSRAPNCSSNVPLIRISSFVRYCSEFLMILWEKILTKICTGCIKYHFKDRMWKEFVRGRNFGSFWKYSGQMYSRAFSSTTFSLFFFNSMEENIIPAVEKNYRKHWQRVGLAFHSCRRRYPEIHII